MAAHKHAALMLQYAQDAAETDEPWKRWEFKAPNTEWLEFRTHPEWASAYDYRRKPRTIRIGEYDVPEPLTTQDSFAPGAWLYVVALDNIETICRTPSYPGLRAFIDRGIVHATSEAAELHAKALISLSAPK